MKARFEGGLESRRGGDKAYPEDDGEEDDEVGEEDPKGPAGNLGFARRLFDGPLIDDVGKVLQPRVHVCGLFGSQNQNYDDDDDDAEKGQMLEFEGSFK